MEHFETTYNNNYRSMYNIGLKMINDKDVICDIIQDVFISYYQKTKEARTINNPKSWLIRATINKCIDHLKNQQKYTKIETAELSLTSDESNDKKEDQAVIKTALSKLNERERALATLYSQGLSYKEIAEITGINVNSIGKMLSRTLKKLDRILKKLNYEMY